MKRREVQWERMFPDELETAVTACPIVYMPYGLSEPHGAINALGLDALRAHGTCVAAAREFGGIVAPPCYWNCHEVGVYASWGEEVIGNERPWLTALPPWMFFKTVFYHLRAVEAAGFKAAVILSGHSGPHGRDFPVFLEIIQPHLAIQADVFMGLGTEQSRFDDGGDMGGHAGRGETSMLWAVAPDCVDLSRLPASDAAKPLYALGGLNSESSRRAGELMVRDAAANLHSRANDLASAYNAPADRKPLTFTQVEEIWNADVRPRLNGFASMQTGDNEPPPDSIWQGNWAIPNGDDL